MQLILRGTERTGDGGVRDEELNVSDKWQHKRRRGKISDQMEKKILACRRRQRAAQRETSTSHQSGCIDLVILLERSWWSSIGVTEPQSFNALAADRAQVTLKESFKRVRVRQIRATKRSSIMKQLRQAEVSGSCVLQMQVLDAYVRFYNVVGWKRELKRSHGKAEEQVKRHKSNK